MNGSIRFWDRRRKPHTLKGCEQTGSVIAMSGWTTVTVQKEAEELLKRFRIAKRESY